MILFNDLEFETFTEIAINSAIEQVNESDILNADLSNEAKKIIDSLTFTVPVIEKEKITTTFAMEDHSGKSYTINNNTGKDLDIFATATYKVPFTGNAEIFKVKPLTNEYNDQEFVLANEYLLFKLRTAQETVDISDTCKSDLVKSSMEILNFLDYNLQNLEINFSAFKNEIIGPIIQALKERKEKLLRSQVIAKEINIFNDQK